MTDDDKRPRIVLRPTQTVTVGGGDGSGLIGLLFAVIGLLAALGTFR